MLAAAAADATDVDTFATGAAGGSCTMGRASPPSPPPNPPCAAKAAAPTIAAPAASHIHFVLPAIFSLPASLHIVETEGRARPDGLGPGLAVDRKSTRLNSSH